jgi:hypothetical protein
MLSRRTSWAGAAALFLLGVGGLWTVYGTHAVSLDEGRIQTVIDKELGREIPVKGAASLLVRSVRGKSASVRIRGGRAAVLLGVEGALRNGKKFTLTASASGVPRYSSGEFYFEPEQVEVQNLAYEGASAAELISRLGALHLANPRMRRLIEDKAQKLEEWAMVVAQNAAKDALERRPIYRTKDDIKGMLIKSSLDSVTIEDNRIVLAFSFWRLTISAVLGAISWIGAVLLALVVIRRPFTAL